MENLKGPFNDIIPKFQKYKKSLGYQYDNISDFYRIDKTLKKNHCNSYKDIEKVYEILITQEIDDRKKERNYICLKELYHFIEKDTNQKLKLKPYYSKNKAKFKATILTPTQINSFFEKLDKYCDNQSSKKYIIFPVLFRLVYSNGLRISEALNLKTSHFSKENRTIFINESKKNTDRLLPLSDSMYLTLETYEKDVNLKKQEYLFELDHKKVTYSQVKKVFDEVLELLDFHFRIHDLRHNFTLTNFNNLFDLNYPEDWILYYLHFYLGHKRIESTEYYLQLSSDRYKKMIKKMDKINTNLFPKVGDSK